MVIAPCESCKHRSPRPLSGCVLHERLKRRRLFGADALRNLVERFLPGAEVTKWEPDRLLELECPRYEKDG